MSKLCIMNVEIVHDFLEIPDVAHVDDDEGAK
jgi:hypothetical protein